MRSLFKKSFLVDTTCRGDAYQIQRLQPSSRSSGPTSGSSIHHGKGTDRLSRVAKACLISSSQNPSRRQLNLFSSQCCFTEGRAYWVFIRFWCILPMISSSLVSIVLNSKFFLCFQWDLLNEMLTQKTEKKHLDHENS